MASYIATDTELTSVADAIRTKGGTNNSLTFPNGFISAVENIGGGGGGGDASTATITLVDPNEMGYILFGPFYSGSTAHPKCFTDDGEIGVLLYKNSAQVDAVNVFEEGGSFTVSGNATASESFITITGDCTITIS